MKARLPVVCLVVLILLIVSVSVPFGNEGRREVVLYFFWLEGCGTCEQAKPRLGRLKEKYPQLQVEKKELSSDPENRKLLTKLGEEYGKKIQGVPATFVGDEVWIGYTNKIGDEIEKKIQYCIENPCRNPVKLLEGDTQPGTTAGSGKNSPGRQVIDFPFIGPIDLSSMSIYLATGLIAFVDGFNPCSLWVLTFLLGLLIYTKSRKRIVLVGLTFLTVTAVAYGLFILGLFSMFQFIGKLLWIRVLVAVFAVSFGLVNVKDYFWFQEGLSLTIPETYKLEIGDKARKLIDKGKTLPAVMAATALMALGVTLVELPCTAGFPVIWTGILSARDLSGPVFVGLFLGYMVIYLFDELLVFGTVAVTLESSRIREEHGKVLKLVGGTLMLTLGTSFLFAPGLMENVKGSLIVFGVAVVASLFLILLRRRLLPLLGIDA